MNKPGRSVCSLQTTDRKNSYVKGSAMFYTDHTIDIWLVHGCYPKVIGREPRDLGQLQVKAKSQGVSDQTWEIGVYSRLWYLDSKKRHLKKC